MKRVFTYSVCSVLFASFLFAAVYASDTSTYTTDRAAPQLYKSYCAECHGNDGRAKTLKSKLRYHARDLTDRRWQADVTDERLFNSIVHGKGKMPSFAKKLTDSEVGSLVQYVRAFNK